MKRTYSQQDQPNHFADCLTFNCFRINFHNLGIEAEAVMLGQSISMLLPEVIGYKIVGSLNQYVTSTDLVLTITKVSTSFVHFHNGLCAIVKLIWLYFEQHLRQVGVVGKFVEFFGSGVSALSIADRATISNMCPEYGATVGFFPVDVNSLTYLKQTSTLIRGGTESNSCKPFSGFSYLRIRIF